MKRRLKAILKAGWRATFPLRRPFTTRLEAFLRRCLSSQSDDRDVVLDHVIRELVRLQDQVERLQESVDALSHPVGWTVYDPGEKVKAG